VAWAIEQGNIMFTAHVDQAGQAVDSKPCKYTDKIRPDINITRSTGVCTELRN
jgi:hypothetical protein